jgi:Spy/CpxP family protein refolding chaperone
MKLKTKTRWITAVMVATTLVVLGAPMALQGFVQEADPYGPPFGTRGRGFRGPGGPGFMHGRMLRQLDLSDDQIDQLKALRESHYNQTKIERDKIRKDQEVFQNATTALEEGHGTAGAVRNAAAAMAAAQAELAIVSSGFRREFLSILTDEQIEKMKELRAEAEMRRKERGKDRQGRRMQP